MTSTLIILAFFLQHLATISQIVLDLTDKSIKRSYIGVPGGVIDSNPRPQLILPFSLTLEDCSIHDEKLTLLLRINNRSSSRQNIPLSLDQAKVHSVGSHKRATMYLSIYPKGSDPELGAQMSIGLYSSGDDNTSHFVLNPSATVLLKLTLGRSELRWKEVSEMGIAVQEFFIRDDSYMTSQTSSPLTSENTLVIHSDKCSISSAIR